MAEHTKNDVLEILGAVRGTLGARPALRNSAVTVGDPFEFDCVDDAMRAEVLIDGRLYAVTVEPCDT